MDKHTWGNSQASVNLITQILIQPEYQQYSKFVRRHLTKQSVALNYIMSIPSKSIRETTLKMWHDKFFLQVISLPEVVKTHVLCVETSIYRQLLKDSKIKGGI